MALSVLMPCRGIKTTGLGLDISVPFQSPRKRRACSPLRLGQKSKIVMGLSGVALR
jgi:hypothetical protein